MKNILVLSLMFIFFTGCKKDDTVSEMKISVLSYNVAGLPEGISSSHPATNTVQISKMLSPYQIIHVQEDFCYHAQLYKYDNHAHRTITSGCVPGGDGLNTLSDFAIINFKRVKWNDCNGTDCLTPKGFTYCQLIINGQKIDFYNVHANAGTEPGDLRARKNNISQLTTFINKNSANQPCMVFGDFNCRYTREDDDIRLLLDEGFEDVWLEIIRNSSVPEKGIPSLMNCDDKNNPDCEVVDKILCRSNDKVNIVPYRYQLDNESFYDNRGNPLSDHFPLSADFTFYFN